MTISLATLLIQESKEAIYRTGLGIATALGLPVTTWQAGDPTRSLYNFESEILSKLEPLAAGFISSGFLDYAHEAWLKVCAKQGFNVDVPAATFATCDEVLTNGGGSVLDFEPGDITFKSSISGKTYRNTTGGHLGSGGTLTVSITADEAGSGSSAGAGEIDTLVTVLLGVTCTNPLAAVGIDEQDEATTILQCRDKLGSLSPNGPKEAYSYVARNSDLTGTNGITRVRVYSSSTTGDVTVYLAGPSGGASPTDVGLVTTAIGLWATPLCVTATVLAASTVPVAVTYSIWLYKSVGKTASEIEADILSALEQMFANRPIGGDIIPPSTTGILSVSLIESTIRALYPQAFRVVVSLPAGDVAISNAGVATLGTVIPTVVLVVDP